MISSDGAHIHVCAENWSAPSSGHVVRVAEPLRVLSVISERRTPPRSLWVCAGAARPAPGPPGLGCSGSSCTCAAGTPERSTGAAAIPGEPSLHRCGSDTRCVPSFPLPPHTPHLCCAQRPAPCPCSALWASARSRTAAAPGCFGGPAVRRSRLPRCGCAGSWCLGPSGLRGWRSGGGPRSRGSGRCRAVRSGAWSWPPGRPLHPSRTHSPAAYATHTSPETSRTNPHYHTVLWSVISQSEGSKYTLKTGVTLLWENYFMIISASQFSFPLTRALVQNVSAAPQRLQSVHVDHKLRCDSPAGSVRGIWRAWSDAGWSSTPEPCRPERPRCSWRGGCVRWRLPWRHGPLPLPAGREAGGPGRERRGGQVGRRSGQRERWVKGRGVRVAGSHTGSRAPGERSLMHPERGWERAPKHSWREDGGQITHTWINEHFATLELSVYPQKMQLWRLWQMHKAETGQPAASSRQAGYI